MVLAILQCRMSSTRLPGKALLPILGRPMLLRIIERLRRARTLQGILVATSTSPADDCIEGLARANGVPCFRGNAEDVLDRYYQAACQAKADVVARVTGDCPLLDPQVVDAVVQRFQQGGFDYVSNTLERTYPDGLDVEVLSFAVLERAWREATRPSEREHVTPYLWKHPQQFRLGNVGLGRDLSALRWTVDRAEDLEFVREIYSRMSLPAWGMEEVLEILRINPELMQRNAGLATNEGYAKSLREDARQRMAEG